MSENKYNGWANYSTWCIWSWLGGINKEFETPANIKNYCASEVAASDMDWKRDMVTYCLSHVNWEELADAFKKR